MTKIDKSRPEAAEPPPGTHAPDWWRLKLEAAALRAPPEAETHPSKATAG